MTSSSATESSASSSSRTRAVTLADVAALAGVTAASASRALKHPGRMSLKTELKVRQAALQLGYGLPDPAGNHPPAPTNALPDDRSISSTRRDSFIGVIVSDASNPSFGPLIQALQHMLDRQGLQVIVMDAQSDAEREYALARRCTEIAAGLVLVAPRMAETRIARIAQVRPTVTFDRPVSSASGVETDCQMAINEAMSLLNDMNHRTITYLAGPKEVWLGERQRQWIAAAAARFDMRFENLPTHRYDVEGGREAYQSMRSRLPDAVIGFNDALTMGFAAEARDGGIQVPEDVSLISFGDSPATGCMTPSLTSIAAPAEQAAKRLASTLIGTMRNPQRKPIDHHRIYATLRLRSSLKRKIAPLNRKRINLALNDSPDIIDLTLLSSSTQEALPRIDAFMRRYPTIRITPVEGGSQTETMQRFAASVRDHHNVPDLLNLECQYLPQFAADGVLLDFSNTTIERAWSRDFVPQTWRNAHYASGLYGVPGDLSRMVMFYRRDIFERFGLSIPHTWQEYHQTGLELKRSNPSATMGLLDTSRSQPYWMFFHMNDATPWSVDEKRNIITFRFGDERVQRTAQFIQQCINNGVLRQESWSLARNYSYVPAIGNGEYATIVHANWLGRMIAATYPHDQGNWRIAPAPVFGGLGWRDCQIGGSLIAVSNAIPRVKQAPALAFAHWFQSHPDAVALRTPGSMSAATTFINGVTGGNYVDSYFGQNVYAVVLDQPASPQPDASQRDWRPLPFMTQVDTDFRAIIAPALVSGGASPSKLLQLQENLTSYAREHGFEVRSE
ncbi:extracellular solute-binding protein [Bifidobacterium scaligerum]|uniref:HTH lacI-type domain-containing protein n=1 Tax=Bifidobacterium scaligerum TaxID=2052656 RepID=A0A2M9HSC3_9BIFI|nr:extracellular solute-binding protein [Bifidobacterium scaligerum]PJM79714.1 hypothetical protein CUU80_00745 [Bifidobacterium scaligerum]